MATLIQTGLTLYAPKRRQKQSVFINREKTPARFIDPPQAAPIRECDEAAAKSRGNPGMYLTASIPGFMADFAYLCGKSHSHKPDIGLYSLSAFIFKVTQAVLNLKSVNRNRFEKIEAGMQKSSDTANEEDGLQTADCDE